MKIYVKAIMDEDVFDELCSYPERRVAIMDLLGKEIYNKIMILQRE